MPPKRPTSDGPAATSRPRKSRRSGDGNPQAEANGESSRSSAGSGEAGTSTAARKGAAKSRWTPHSGSANIDASYQLMTQDKEKAYSYICICRSFFDNSSHGDEEDAENGQEGDDANGQTRTPCDGGKTCLCLKPAAEHPEHPWVTTYAGQLKYHNLHLHLDLRSPDDFDMYTFNDHEAYGWMEVWQNLLLDYEEAGRDKNWREQWVVCEALGRMGQHAANGQLCMVDDGEGLCKLNLLVGVMFLDMLYTLEREGQLSATSEIKDLGVIMGLFVKYAVDMRLADALEPELLDESADNDAPRQGPFLFDSYILAYARKYAIPLPKAAEKAADEDELPDMGELLPPPASGPPDKCNSPWHFEDELKKYKSEYGTRKGPQGQTIGGDLLDITSWKPSERRAKSFNHKDPLSRQILEGLKRGDVLQAA